MHHTTKKKDNKRVHIVAWAFHRGEFFLEVACAKVSGCTYVCKQENWDTYKVFQINPALVGRE